MNNWDHEYRQRGIPSSFRDEPSGVLTWTLDNWPHLTGKAKPATAVDIGCGTGRNAIYMAGLNIKVIAFDSSEVALQTAQARLSDGHLSNPPAFLKYDLVNGIPAETGQIEFAADIFVYKHQLLPSTRAIYRRELKRVLHPKGRLLISLAERDDGYYDTCPELNVSETGNPRTIIDPVVGIGSVLFSLEELAMEMSDLFVLEMSWHKAKVGMMHNDQYMRHTLATIWHVKEDQNVAT